MNKRLFGSFSALSAISAVVVILALLLRAQTPQPTANLDSPLPTPPPKAATVTKTEPTPWPTQKPTSTRPPEPTPRPPTPKPTLGPPTPTPGPLPTLLPGRDTFVYSTTGERGPEIWRVQPDETGRIVARGMLIHFSEAWGYRTVVRGLYPSPNGKYVAIDWILGEGGTFVSIIDSQSGRVSPLFGRSAEIDQRVLFLDWYPNSEEVLVFGRSTNPDLRNELWRVNINTGMYISLGTTHNDGISIWNASFSPKGKRIVYTYTECYSCPNELWITNIQNSDKRLVYRTDDYTIEDVQWSPLNEQIAFTLRYRSSQNVVQGDLWLIEASGNELKRAAPVITSASPELYHDGFKPAWSPNGRYLAFISGEANAHDGNLDWRHGLGTNVSVMDTETMAVREVSSFKGALVMSPSWSPQSDKLLFMVNSDGHQIYQPWVASAAFEVEKLEAAGEFIIKTDYTHPEFIWLPNGDEK